MSERQPVPSFAGARILAERIRPLSPIPLPLLRFLPPYKDRGDNKYPGILIVVGRRSLTDEEREQGRALVDVLKRVRKERELAAEDLASDAEMRIDTLRRIERFQTFNPGFFTVVRLADALQLDLDHLRDLTDKELAKRQRRARGRSKKRVG